MNRHVIEFKLSGTFTVTVDAPESEDYNRIDEMAVSELWDALNDLAINHQLEEYFDVEEYEHTVEPTDD